MGVRKRSSYTPLVKHECSSHILSLAWSGPQQTRWTRSYRTSSSPSGSFWCHLPSRCSSSSQFPNSSQCSSTSQCSSSSQFPNSSQCPCSSQFYNSSTCSSLPASPPDHSRACSRQPKLLDTTCCSKSC